MRQGGRRDDQRRGGKPSISHASCRGAENAATYRLRSRPYPANTRETVVPAVWRPGSRRSADRRAVVCTMSGLDELLTRQHDLADGAVRIEPHEQIVRIAFEFRLRTSNDVVPSLGVLGIWWPEHLAHLLR